MIRNLKALGLALVAVFVLSAVVASAASAQQGTLTGGPVTMTGVETGEEKASATTMFGLTIACPGSTYTWHKYNQTPHTFIPNSATTFTLTPHYNQSQCKITGLNWPMTIDMNGCDYVAHFGETTGGAHTYGITFDLDCPAGNEITLTVWTPGQAHTNPPICVVHFGEAGNQGLGGLHVTDPTNNHINIVGAVEGVDATRTASTHVPILCPETTTSIIKWDTDITVSGRNELGGTANLGITHP